MANEVEVKVFSSDGWDEKHKYPENLMEFVQFLLNHAQSIPPQFRNTAKFEMHDGGEDYSGWIEITYWRPRTPEETAALAKQTREYHEYYEAKRRAEYERLKAYFESKE